MKPVYRSILFVTLVFAGCAAPIPQGAERGSDGTIAYTVPIEASEPGVKIEVNHKPAGIAPVSVKIFGDRDGTFHNFGSDEYVVRAYPPDAKQFPQTKIFKTGAMGVKDDKVPQRIYFDFNEPGAKPK